MSFKRLLPKILLVAGFLSLLFIIKYQGQIKDLLWVNLDKAKDYVDYVSYDLNYEAKRHRPVSLLVRETELKLYIGAPFRDFNRGDWEKFWNIIYGIFPKAGPKEPGLVSKRRQLTEDEITYELIKMYTQPFNYFREEHWKMFFSIIFKK
ncbi:MAG: hypothetical protein WC616_04415 [Candidatus Omnitrophota bacterium]